MLASEKDNTPIVKLLLAHPGIDAKLQDKARRTYYGLTTQSFYQHVLYFIFAQDGCTAPRLAFKNRCFDIVKMLLVHPGIEANWQEQVIEQLFVFVPLADVSF